MKSEGKILKSLLLIILVLAVEAWSQIPPVVDLADFSEDLRIISNVELELFGSDVAAGDFNGDGFDDLLVGAYGAKNEEGYMAGRAYIVFGGPHLPPMLDLSREGTRSTVIHGDDMDDYTGWVVATGDINGDSIVDAVIGTSQTFHPVGRGTVYVVFGRRDWPGEIDLNTNGRPVPGVTRILGKEEQDFAGDRIATGDVDGDGLCDLVIGAFGAGPLGHLGNHGEVYVLYGRAELPEIIELGDSRYKLTTITGIKDHRIGEFLGCGDVNNDGFADTFVSLIQYSGKDRFLSGRVDVLFGRAHMPDSVALEDLENADVSFSTVIGEALGDRIGWRTESGDFNGDGINDLLIGCETRTSDGYDSIGKMFVLFGMQEWPPDIDLLTHPGQLKLYAGIGHFGHDVAAGDFNADGFSDVVVGETDAQTARFKSGKAYVIYGGAGLQGTKDLREPGALADVTQILGYQRIQDLGHAATSGDINGDGIADLIVSGYESQTPGGDLSGEVYVIYGRREPRMLPPGQKQQLLQSYPNPFNANAMIVYRLAEAQSVDLAIYDVTGRKVRQLVRGWKEAGEHTASWNGLNEHFNPAGSGIYFGHIRAAGFSDSVKIVLVK